MKKLTVVTVLFIFTAAQVSAQSDASQMMERWLSLESQRGKMNADWNTRQQQLISKISLLEKEEKALRDVIDSSSDEKSKVDARREEMLAAQQRLEKEQKRVANFVSRAAAKLHAFIPRLPPPVRAEWQGKLGLLDEENVTTSEKLERVLGLMKVAEDFNDRIAINRTPMSLPAESGGTNDVMVTQIYLGLAQGWYVSDDGSYTGFGRGTEDGWRWWHGEEAESQLGQPLSADALLNVRSILNNPTKARFVSLPITIQREGLQ